MTDKQQPTWRDYLHAKGIYEASQHDAIGWSSPEGDDYIQYQTVDSDGNPWTTPLDQPGKRHIKWRNRDQGGIRFFFSPRKPEKFDSATPYHPHWWTPKGVWEAVKAKGKLIIACGETDMLSFRSAGAEHVVTFYGENNYPPDLPQQLRERGVLNVHYYPDQDATGLLVACKLYFLFKQAAIPYQSLTIHHLPASITDTPIKDINDVWVSLGCDAEEFRNNERYPEYTVAELFGQLTDLYEAKGDKGVRDLTTDIRAWSQAGRLDLLRLDKSAEAVLDRWTQLGAMPKVTSTENPIHSYPDDKQIPDNLWFLIETAAGASIPNGRSLEYGSDGWSQNIPCPFRSHEHDQKEPAFGINNQLYVWKCQKCGDRGGWKRLAEAYGINLAEVLPRRQNGADSGLKTHLSSAVSKKPTSAVDRFVDIQTAAKQTMRTLRGWHADPREVRGMPTGISKGFDRLVHGVWTEPEGDLMVFLARPGNGKSTLMLQIALRLSLVRPVYFISPEMSPYMQTLRIGCIGAGYDIHALLSGEIQDINRVEQTYWNLIGDRRIHFLDGGCTLQDLKGDPHHGVQGIGDFVIQQGGVLIVDSIQNVKGANPNEKGWAFIEDVMVELERISLRIPILGTAQANRDSADRRDKTPQYTDAAGGSAIEARSKRLIGIHRPWLDEKTGGGKIEASPSEAWMTVLKDRFTGRVGEQREIGFGVTGQGGYGFYGLHSDGYETLMEAR